MLRAALTAAQAECDIASMRASLSRRNWLRLLAAGVVAPGGQTHLVTQIVELTGAHATFGDAWRNGVEMAAQEINAAGGMFGKLVQVMTFDTQSTLAGGRAAMVKALEGEALAVLGPTMSDPARGALTVPRPVRALLLGAGATDLLGATHPCTFRTLPSEAALMGRLAGAVKDAGARRLAILAATHDPYRGRAEALGRAARAAGLDVTDGAVATDLFAELPRLLRAAPDALALLLAPELAGRVAAEARRQAAALKFIGGASLLTPKAIEAAGAAAEGLQAQTLLPDDAAAPEPQAFAARFLAFAKEPASEPALAGYAALMAVKAACDQMGAADAHGLCAALRTLKPASPALMLGDGFSADGEINRPSWLMEWRQGRAGVVRKLG